ncbi:MAG: hypothetical protein ABSF45_05510 [Terriglobia bacterium]
MPSNQIPVHPEQSPRLSSHFGVLVREDVAFANHKGVEKGGIRKQTEQALEKLQEPLRKFLEPDEAVFCITRAQIMPSGVEQFFLGWHAMFLAPAVLVLTNRRLLHLLVQRNGSWKRSLRCANWGDMEEAKVKGLLGARLHTKFRDGRKEIYSGITGNNKNKIRLLLETLIPVAAGEASPALAMTSLCPECRSPLTPGLYECPHCRIAFKDENTAMKRAWLIPGGGFFYIGHPLLGILHAFLDVVLICAVGYWVLVGVGVVPPDTNPGEAPMDKASALVAAALMGGILAMDKWVVATVARKQVRNYIPLS